MLLELLINNVDNLHNKTMFSIGCGNGNFEHKLIIEKRIKSVYCINVSDFGKSWEFDKKNKVPGLTYEIADFIKK